MAGQVYNQSGFTIVLKARYKSCQVLIWHWVGWSVKSLQDADPQAVHMLIEYFNNCQRNMMGKRGGAF